MKRFTRLLGLGFLSVSALAAFTSCEKTGFKVGLLCLHGQTSTYDNNFIEAFEKACETNKLTKNEYSIKTDVAEDYNRIYTASKEWAEDGYSLVCADSFGHQYGMLPVAKEYPNTEFCHATGTCAPVNPDVKNFHNGFASIYKGRFLTGVIAGYKMAEDIKNNKYTINDALIGYVGAMPYAEVISGYTSFYLGTKYGLNKNDLDGSKLRMKVRYTNSWYNYKAEKEAAEVLIGDGCKLISQHADSMGAPIACKEKGIPNVCYNVETNQSCPDTFLVASRINWYEYFDKAIKVARENYNCRQAGTTPTLKLQNDYCGELKWGAMGASPVDFCRDKDGNIVYGKLVSEEAKKAVEEIATDIMKDEIRVFDTSTFKIKDGVQKKEVKDSDGNIHKVYEVDSENRLTEYYPDCVDVEPSYMPDGINVIKKDTKTGISYVDESYVNDKDKNSLRSAPYFALIIDGIEIDG